MQDFRYEYGPCLNLRLDRHRENLSDDSWWKSQAFVDTIANANREMDQRPWGPQLMSPHRKGVQANIYKELCVEVLSNDLVMIVLPRIRKFIGNDALVQTLANEMHVALKLAKAESPQLAWTLVKTRCNSWVTSSRFGGGLNPCAFGCHPTTDAIRDATSHYLTCPVLWGPIMGRIKTHSNCS